MKKKLHCPLSIVHCQLLLLMLIFIVHLFLRFYEFEYRSPFAWDQVGNAWVAKNMIVNHKWPLLGMVAKQNTGIYIGPIYYYLLTPFYFLTNLDPRASTFFAGFISIVTFWGLFFIIKKIFSFRIALFAAFINTIAMNSIVFDRLQWPVALLPLVSIAILYTLFKVVSGNSKFMLILATLLGFSFHLHFTAVFFPIIVLLSLPFFPRNKKTIKYIFISIPLFLIWLLPNIIAELQAKNIHTGNLLSYIGTYYHGFHLTRFLQLSPDAFIQFEPFLFPVIKILKYVLVPLFFLIYMHSNDNKKSKIFCYLILLWFLIPWVVFTTYKGEISDYYFSINRYLIIAILAYLLNFIFEQRYIAVKALMIILLGIYSYINTANFFAYHTDGSLKQKREDVNKAIKEGKVIDFTEGDPKSYIYYIYTRKKQ